MVLYAIRGKLPPDSQLHGCCESCWREEVVNLATCITVDDDGEDNEVTENEEYMNLKDIILSNHSEFGIELASAALYYQINTIVRTKRLLKWVHIYLVCSYWRLDQIRHGLGLDCSSNIEQKDKVYKGKIDFVNKLISLVIDFGVMTTDPEMASSFYESVKDYREAMGDTMAYEIPVRVILDCCKEKPLETIEYTTELLEFFSALIKRYKQHNIFERIATPMLKSLSSMVRQPGSSPIDERGPLEILDILVNNEVVSLLPKLPFWLPKKNILLPSEIQRDTFLGPFLSSYNIYPEFGSNLTSVLFPENYTSTDIDLNSNDSSGFYIGNRILYDVESMMYYICGRYESVTASLHRCVIKIIRSVEEGKEAVLKYISAIVKFNKSRAKMQSNSKKHCSDGFMQNLSVVCMLLCKPFTNERSLFKVNSVDPYYFILSDRIDNSEFVGINSDTKQRSEYTKKLASRKVSSTYNFITEIFFLTLLCNHVGILTICNNHMTLIKEIELARERVKKMRDIKAAGKSADRVTLAANDFILKFNEKQLEELTGNRLCIDAMLKNTMTIDTLLEFYNFALLYIIRCILVSQEDIEYRYTNRAKDDVDWLQFFMGNAQGLCIEIPSDHVPDIVAYTPEWIIEDICDFYAFFLNNNERSMKKRESLNELMTFIVILLKNSHIINNPYVKVKIVEILHFLVIPTTRNERETLDFSAPNPLLRSHSLAEQYLVESLLNYYAAVEHNSMTNQFYERFKTRFFISQILRSAFNFPGHQEKLLLYTRDPDTFTKFALLLTNDVSYLLDESIGKLREIQHLERELASRNSNSSATNDGMNTNISDEEKEAQLRALEEQATSYISLGNEALKFFHTLVVKFNIVNQFLTHEICERLTAMLNYNLTALVGPKCTELKVKNPSKYLFEPRRMLEKVVSIYLKFIDSEDFVLAASRDCRSYRKETFERVINILKRSRICTEREVEGPLMMFVDRVERAIESQNSYYEKLGGIPEEFLDPLVYSLMEDPVTLPKSGVTVDRSTIKTHLLADEHDPYNRTPLKISEVIDNTELRLKIQKWLESKNADDNSEK